MSLRRVLWFVGVAALVVLPRGNPHATAAPEPGAAVPILVELFTAEGCSSCPPADVLLDKMIETQPAGGALLVGLGEHVDYWDQSGWKDRFSSAAFTKRQQQYAGRAKTEEIYTPEMVVDGGSGFVGTDINSARQAIEHAIAAPHGVIHVAVDPRSDDPNKVALTVEIGQLPSSGDDTADLLIAATEDGLRTEVKRGENRGRTLKHAAVVHKMLTVGAVTAPQYSGRATIDLSSQWQRARVKLVAFVQERRSRRILATAAMPLENGR